MQDDGGVYSERNGEGYKVYKRASDGSVEQRAQRLVDHGVGRDGRAEPLGLGDALVVDGEDLAELQRENLGLAEHRRGFDLFRVSLLQICHEAATGGRSAITASVSAEQRTHRTAELDGEFEDLSGQRANVSERTSSKPCR